MSFECRVDGPDGAGEFGACTSPWTIEGLKDGERTFHVRATDAAKNVGAAPDAGLHGQAAAARRRDLRGQRGRRRRRLHQGQALSHLLARVRGGQRRGRGDLRHARRLRRSGVAEGSKKLTVRATDDSRPTVRYLTARSNDITLEGLRIEKLTIYGSRQTYDNVHVDGRFLRHPGIEHLLGDDNTFKNGRVGNITDEKGALIGPKRFTFENVVFHDVLVTDESVHNECLYATGAEGLTVRRSTFHACATMDLFVDQLHRRTPTSATDHAREQHLRALDDGSPRLLALLQRRGPPRRRCAARLGRAQQHVRARRHGGPGDRVRPLGGQPRRLGLRLRRHATGFNVGNACGELDSGVFPAASTKVRPAAFGWLNPAAFDFRLGANSPALDNADPEDFPTTDRNGAPRPNGFGPDAGALERVD